MRMEDVGWRGGRMRMEDEDNFWEEGYGKEVGVGQSKAPQAYIAIFLD